MNKTNPSLIKRISVLLLLPIFITPAIADDNHSGQTEPVELLIDPVGGIIPIRMGCGGLKGIAGKGRLAGMVGSICFNGTLNFNQFDQTVLTGASKCTITLHTPVNPGSIP